MAEKLPYIRWFPADWLSEETLRGRTLAARGLWIDMLCIMHKSSRRGFLLNKVGAPIDPSQLAVMVGAGAKEVTRLLQELERAETFSRDKEGVIYCRRMVRQEEIDAVYRHNGGKGGRPKNQNGTKPKPPPNQTHDSDYASASDSLISSFDEKEDGPPGPPRFDLHRLGRIPGLVTPIEQLADTMRAIFGPEKARRLHNGQIQNLDRMIADHGVDDVYEFFGPRIALGDPFGKVRDEYWAFKKAAAKTVKPKPAKTAAERYREKYGDD